ncbi:MAG TPA: XdhC family protein [Nocardioides sp.]|uniref:XdhC family protein n=1 Tax=Nocardioides sp. TaxID=35761 RepID=UPI002E2EDE39|nr:XdhC family protein [Nocardioides sp.]HEX3931542.1 XdhC family protein [Nocardioides sp.]
MVPTHREQPWSDEAPERGRILVLSDNPISRAIVAIGTATGRVVVVQADDEGGPGLAPLDPAAGDAVVLCDHDAPDAPRFLRDALASRASYVAMMASRRRSEGLLADLADEAAPGLDKLHVPAGHNLGGKDPGEIALSVVAEIVAESYERPGGPMRGPR